MKQLVIKGHATRGKEIIDLLEMLGAHRLGYNDTFTEFYYYIEDDAICSSEKCPMYATILTLEEFEQKFPYKVGDKVSSKYLKNYKIEKMEWEDANNHVIYKLQGMGWYTTNELQPYKKETIEEININKIGFNGDKARLILPHGYKFEAEGNEVFVIKKKSKYPKTYVECATLLDTFCGSIEGYNSKLLHYFQQLLICRNAYWKIAGEEMGLGKPWEPDFGNESEYKYGIFRLRNIIYKDATSINPKLLVFPTKEIRDVFYEYFEDLIEGCKELV